MPKKKSIKLVGYVALPKWIAVENIKPVDIGDACRANDCGATKAQCEELANMNPDYDHTDRTPYRVEMTITRVRW